MTGQGRTLMALGGVLAAAIAVAVWLAVGSSTDSGGDVAERPADAAERADAAGKTPEAARRRAKPKGTASVVGEVRRSKGKVPVPEQDVQLVPEKGDPWTVKTDGNGAFKLTELPHGGPYELRVAAVGCGTIHIPGIALERHETRDVGTLWLDPSVSVAVQVRTWSDQPVEGAVVEAFAVAQQDNYDWSKMYSQMAQTPIAVARTKTDAKGEASFPEIAVGRWTFTATKDGFARAGRAGVTLRSDVAPSPVKLYLGKGHALSGRVLDAAKAPVVGASVLVGANAGWDPSNAPLRARTKSDAEGRYAFAALEAGDAAMLAARPGGVPASVATLKIPDVSQFDVILKATATVTGTVTEKDGGKPVEGALVRGWSTSAAEATTGADGKYSLAIAEGTVSQLTAEKDGFVAADDPSRPKPPMQVRAGETATRDVVLTKAAKVTGVVKGPDGPVAGAKAWVHLAPTAGMGRGGAMQKSSSTDAEGRYEVGSLPAGTAVVQVIAPGLYVKDLPDNWYQLLQNAGPSALKFDVPAGGAATRDVEMVRGVAVEGRVDGPDGPLDGVRVTQPSDTEGGVTTGADGAFRVEGVKPSANVWLFCAKDGYSQSSDNKQIAVAADQPTTGIVLKMLRMAVVKGTVTAADGAPLSEVKVTLNAWSDRNGGVTSFTSSRADAGASAPVRPDGTYELQLAPVSGGKFRVTATASDRPTTLSENQTVTDGQAEYVVNLTMDAGKDFEGRVVSKQGGAAVPGALVSISPRGNSGSTAQDRMMQMRMDAYNAGGSGAAIVWAVADADGRFAVAHLSSGYYSVNARADGFVAGSAMLDLATAHQVTVELEPEMSIDGAVTFADGSPVEGASLSAAPDQPGRPTPDRFVFRGSLSATTGVGGRFHVGGLATGAYRLTVSASWQSDLNVKTKSTDPIAAGSSDVKIVVEAGGVIAGRVLDPRKQGLAGIWVSANAELKQSRGGGGGGGRGGGDNRNAMTKSDGSFSIVGLSDGSTFQINVQSSQGWDMSGGPSYKNVNLPGVAVGTKNLEIVLEEGLTITGVLVGADGKPIANALLFCTSTSADGRSRQSRNAMTDGDGGFTIGGLDSGDCMLQLQDRGGSGAGLVLENADKIPAGAKDLRLVASKGATITGSVADDSGKPIRNAVVNANPKGGGRSGGARVNDDGTFEVAGLVAGASYVLTVNAQGYIAANADDVAAGTNGVRFALHKGLEASGRVLDESGAVVKSARILIHLAGNSDRRTYAMIDEAGNFAVTGLLEGTYEAELLLPGSTKGYRKCGTFKAGDSGVELHVQP